MPKIEVAGFFGYSSNPGGQFSGTTASFGGSFTCFLIRGLALDAGVQYDNQSLDGRWLWDGQTLWSDLNAKWVFRRDEAFQPYLTGGFTFVRTSGTSMLFDWEVPSFEIGHKSYSGNTFNVGAGIRYWLTPRIALYGEIKAGGPCERLGDAWFGYNVFFGRLRMGLAYGF